MEEEVEILDEPEGMEETRRTRFSESIIQGALSSQRLKHIAQGKHGSAQVFYIYIVTVSLVFLWKS